MGTVSKIEWTEQTWNPTVGCTKVSPGYENRFRLTLVPDRLSQPLGRRKPTVYFVNSMSDLFHEKVPFDYVRRIFDVMNRAPQHTFQILTKRAERMAKFCLGVKVPGNVWLGVPVENRRYGVPRIGVLRTIRTQVRFLSVEPLLEDLGNIDLSGIQWLIVGGESGSKARPMKPAWVENVKRQCDATRVPFFFKQWGTWGADGEKRSKHANGRQLRGRVWDEMHQPA